ncbi:hypothetical protein vBVpPvVp04M_00047 [Vibrio phage vB_Vp_PvVp04_M]|nr:hypothetical protein vBVpPvVp04M_00047 [Vibrio phage vB_Vp_PvVp04_M]
MSKRKSNKKVKQMICDQLANLDNSVVIRAWFENGRLVAWFNCQTHQTKALLAHGCEISLTANQLRGE